MVEEFKEPLSLNETLFPGNFSSKLLTQFHTFFESFKQPNSRLFIHDKKYSSSFLLALSAFQSEIPYIPVDINNPLSRTKIVFESIEPDFVFTSKESDLYKFIMENEKVNILWENDLSALIHLSTSKINHPYELAAVLFTSGSTGTPKGVMLPRAGMRLFSEWMNNTFKITADSRILSVSPLHFDLSVFDLLALEKNATVYIPQQNSLVNPLYLAEYIYENKIDTIYATPTWFSLLVLYGKLKKYDFSFVKNILLAGEPFKSKLAHDLHHHFPNAVMANLYGPTETNVCLYHILDFSHELLEKAGVISIGQPCPYNAVKIENDASLCIQGSNVFLGYWPNQKSIEFYNTGDVVEYDDNGNYFFKHRLDQMVKRNGYRIEPAEIESCLLSIDGIDQAAITVKTENDKVLLMAHLVLSNSSLTQLKLHEYCLNKLPSYMLPDVYFFHESFPLTGSGKIDRLKLNAHGE